MGDSDQEHGTDRGVRRPHVRHGLSYHPLYATWANMVHRCTNVRHPDYPRYGARGISVHREWRTCVGSFIEWIETNLGPRPVGCTLDRIDNAGHYQPGNLRWATPASQTQNSRLAKLTLEDAREIRRLHSLGTVTVTALGKRFGVTRRAAGMIVAGTSWREPNPQGETTMQYTKEEVAHDPQYAVTMPDVLPETIPDLEPAVLEEIADDILLDSARATKVAKVKGGQASSTNRAWSYGGRVD